MKQSWKLTAVNRWTQFSHKWVAERYSQHDQSLHYMTYFKTLLSKMTMQATNTFSTLDEMRRLETPLDKWYQPCHKLPFETCFSSVSGRHLYCGIRPHYQPNGLFWLRHTNHICGRFPLDSLTLTLRLFRSPKGHANMLINSSVSLMLALLWVQFIWIWLTEHNGLINLIWQIDAESLPPHEHGESFGRGSSSRFTFNTIHGLVTGFRTLGRCIGRRVEELPLSRKSPV